MDLGLSKRGPVQMFDISSLDEDGNIIPFSDQLAIVTHYAHLYDQSYCDSYRTKAEKFINLWVNKFCEEDNSQELNESNPLQTYLFKDIYSVPFPAPKNPKFTFIDLFAGIGGFRLAMQAQGGECVFSSEWNNFSQKTYLANFGDMPFGDITKESIKRLIPTGFDILCAGFPCQPFSIAGVSKKKSLGRETGFKDKTQGTLFFDVADIISRFRPKAFFLENVKNLVSHDKGNTFKVIKETLDEWLSNPQIVTLSKRYAECYTEFCDTKGWTITVPRDAKYVLMHTFAHLLIKQMSMSSGYSSSAIRERIYFGDRMAGILLYTGSADKEGSLGGLVELGTYRKLIPIMRDAFQEALLCTNDPECMNHTPAGDNSNGAACHSCCMISETACENGNRMLDRGLVVPITGREKQAYFKTLVEQLCQLEI